MSALRDGFLSRWSRLKRDGNADEPLPAAPVSPSASPPARVEPELPEGKTLEQLVAELPKVEDLVPGQSLSAFMQAWVPAPLRNAALQRMWLLDPAIRDYVNPALDYAYDYNTPGCAPGFGPMETSEEAVREVAEMFDRALGRKAGAEGEDPACDRTPQDPEGRDAALQPETDDAPQAVLVPSPGDVATDAANRATKPATDDAAMRDKPADIAQIQPARGRNGGALPRC
jgi:hypothetical protein